MTVTHVVTIAVPPFFFWRKHLRQMRLFILEVTETDPGVSLTVQAPSLPSPPADGYWRCLCHQACLHRLASVLLPLLLWSPLCRAIERVPCEAV